MYIHSLFTWVDETFDHQIKQFYWQVSRNAQTDRSHNWSKADFSVEYVLDQNPDYLTMYTIDFEPFGVQKLLNALFSSSGLIDCEIQK